MFLHIARLFPLIALFFLPFMGVMVIAGQSGGESLALAYIIEDDNSVEIYYKTLAGNVQNLTQSEANEYAPSWSPDGQKLAFMSDLNGNFDIYTLHVRSGELQQLTDYDGVDTNPVWSPDGSEIAFLSSREGALNVHVVGSDGSTMTNVTQSARGYHDIDWSPDGEQLAFGTSRLFVINKDGTGLRTVDTMTAGNVYVRWSPDGRYVAYSMFRDPFVISLMSHDGRANRQLATSPSRLVEWHPFMQAVIYVEEDVKGDSLYSIHITTREKQRLLQGEGNINGLAVSPDGRYIAVTRRLRNENGRVSRIELLDIQMGYRVVMVEEPTMVSSTVWRPGS